MCPKTIFMTYRDVYLVFILEKRSSVYPHISFFLQNHNVCTLCFTLSL
uniref:Uncharacterized protein n=1 Tax=Anguilla anguilla TaxID=7936 RepID=A0A0E9PEQ5_ANGAN